MATFYASLAYWYAFTMSFVGFILFVYLALKEASSKARPGLEGLPDAGELAQKFGKAGPAASALACSVLFMVIGTAIGLALDKVKINPFW